MKMSTWHDKIILFINFTVEEVRGDSAVETLKVAGGQICVEFVM